MKFEIKQVLNIEKTNDFNLNEYETIFQAGKYGLWKLDLHDKNLYFSQKCFEMLGYDDKHIYKSFTQIIHPEDVQIFFTTLNKYIENNFNEYVCEFRLRKKDNTYIWIQNVGLALYDDNGNACKIIGSIADVTDRKTWETKLYDIAYYDSLTKLSNNNMLKKDLKILCGKKHKFALIFMDIDNFKIINDTLGHDIGDIFLKKISKMLTSSSNPHCKLYRYSGDEFVFILQNIENKEQVINFIVSLQKNLSNKVFRIKDNQLFVKTTVGISIFPDHSQSPNELLKFSSNAMYYAKDLEKNSYMIYDYTVCLKAVIRSKLENDLRLAVSNNNFEVYYQPQVNLKTNKLIGMEALVRWIKSDGSIIMPSDFIPIAEETGLIIPIGEFVLRNACRQTKLWHDKGFYPLKVSVNLSEKQLENMTFINMVYNVLKETDLEPKYLELEITESTAIKDISHVIRILNKLKNINVKIALDDFGTGYSSLKYLKELPLNTVKIDKCFMDNIENDSKKKAIMKSITILSHDINLNVICEGVETQSQIEFLKSINCDEVQGYYFGKPLNFQEFENMIKTF